jgi:predicted outer membrane repeat protein
MRALHGHVPEAATHLKASGRVAAAQMLKLTIGLPLRDQAGLDAFLKDVYDPASPNYRLFLTSEEFTKRFGPSEADYAAVQAFARANNLAIVETHGNRMLLNVTGTAAAIESAFHITLRTYRHPTENRDFFAPDTEPSVDAALPIADISGLSDFGRPHSNMRPVAAAPPAGTPNNGSAPDGSSYIGDDFRHAYVPGTALTGAGQIVGLLQFNGFQASDIAAYAAAAGGGRSNIVIQTVLMDGYSGTNSPPGEGEVDLDIEMAMAMAPGLSKIMVFEGSVANDILNAMVTNTAVKQFSSSWTWSPGPNATTEALFETMQAQGQSFFNASGDSDAFADGSSNDIDNHNQAHYPTYSPNITRVGGTVLTMIGNGVSYASEKVWNDGTVNSGGGDWGSCGGISFSNVIPTWQQGISMTANHGSTTALNVPDVALTAANVYVVNEGGITGAVGGTSCAAPLWAGFMALVNQQAAAAGSPSAGFINPAIYAIGKGTGDASYASAFHDITTGNNYWPSSPTNFPAVAGYDLCTGWGTPTVNLINALAAYTNTIVYNTFDGVPGSLRYILGSVSNNSTITFAPYLSGSNILLTNGELLLSRSVTIDASMLPGGIQINGNGSTRVFEVPGGVTVTLKALTITNGVAGPNYGGGILNNGTLILSQCTLAGNSSSQGGAMENGGTCYMTNCTVALNSCTGNGGAVDDNNGSLTLTHCTVVSNSAGGLGGGVANFLQTLVLLNSIVAGNGGNDIYNFGQSTIVDSGVNIVPLRSNASGSTNLGPAPLTNAPMLAPLGNYGGPTATMPPLPGSPAIDAAAVTSLAVDERGYIRPVGPAPDIGAVEFQASGVVISSDAGAGSLRYAITYTTNGGTITFSSNLAGSTIKLTSGEMMVSNNLTVDASALPGGLTISGNNASSAFYVSPGVTNTLNNITIANCVASTASLLGYGGAIFVDGTVILNNCTLTNNSASTAGGAIYTRHGQGLAILNESTVAQNSAGYGGAVQNEGTLIANNSTMASNTASVEGGAISTPFGAPDTLIQCTLVGNSSPLGGGIYIAAGGTTISNSIVAGNTGGSTSNISGSYTAIGVNLTNINPMLAALGNYGGPTPTMRPLPGSPAIDACTNGTGFSNDQRGFRRVVGPCADAGAVEFQDASSIVTTNTDSGPGSLRFATTYTTNGANITFSSGLSGSIITLTNGEIILSNNLTIDASGLPGGMTISGNKLGRVFYVGLGLADTFNNLTITGGSGTNGPLVGIGAPTNGSGGPSEGYGGAIATDGSLTLNNCTLETNRAFVGGGVCNTGSGALTVNACTLVQNTATYGGGIDCYTALTANNSTFVSNSAGATGGAINAPFGTPVTINFCTLTGNSSPTGGGLVLSTNNAGAATVFNSIIAGNTGGSSSNISGVYTDNGGNLTDFDPMLAPLGNYGGPTQTMLPLPGSPAIDDGVATMITTDQRGFYRTVGLAPDIGAVETGNTIPGFTPLVTASGDAVNAVGMGGVSLREALAYTATNSTITFSSNLSGATITLTNGQLSIVRKTTIDASALPGGLTISGNGTSRVLYVGSIPASLNSLTIANGFESNGNGGGILCDHNARLSVSNCTFTGNSAIGFGGAIENLGTSLTISQCTFEGNSSTKAGGAIASTGTTGVIQSTLSQNSAGGTNDGAGGIYFSGGPLMITNSIVAGNSAPGGTPQDIYVLGTLTYGGTNIIQSVTDAGGSPTGPVPINAAPQLAALGYYGGPTATMPPLPASPAINGCVNTILLTDQRGLPRPVGQSDIGAVKLDSIVTSLADDGSYGSLRGVLAYSAPVAVVTFAPALSGQNLFLTNGELLMSNNMTIDASALANGITLNGNHANRVMQVPFNATVTLNALTIANGYIFGDDGGGINNSGTMTLNRCTVTGNVANNTSSGGGGIFNGALGYMTLNQCTVEGNSVDRTGGGIEDFGAMTLNECTVSLNTCGVGGGGVDYRGIDIYGGSLALNGTILAGNLPAGSAPDLYNESTPISATYCLIGDGTDSTVTNGVGGNLVGTSAAPLNALLAAPGNYGGPTATMPPMPGSPAIDECTSGTSFTTDQRGASYPRIVGHYADIGAVEANWTNVVVTTTADSGPDSLRDICTYFPAGSYITFAANLSGQTIGLTGGGIMVSNNLIVDGSALGGGVAISGGNVSRIFNIGASGNLTLDSLTLRNANGGGGDGGAILSVGTATLNACTLTANSTGSGGAIVNNSPGSMALNNCTLTANSSALAGGGGAIVNRSRLSLNNCTLANNTSSSGGAIYNDSTGILDYTNTIITGPSAPNIDNLGTLAGLSNLVDTANINLSPLGNFGGPTPTMPPLPGSPAIGAGSGAVTNFLATDQRGFPRTIGGHVDIGAVEGFFNSAIPFGRVIQLGANGNLTSIQLDFTNLSGLNFNVLTTTNVALPINLWSNFGAAVESPAGSGLYQFTDTHTTNFPQRFYSVRFP